MRIQGVRKSMVLAIVVISSLCRGADSTDLHIRTERQFFFDTVMIESIYNVTCTVHRPAPMAEPVLRKDKPWETIPYFTCNTWNVICDPADGVFKCWYEDWQFDPVGYSQTKVRMHDPDVCPSRYLFARSANGVTWEKPSLGIQYEDGRDTNILLGDKEMSLVHAAYVFLDPIARDSRERFKMICDNRKGQQRQFLVLSSEDGIAWRPYQQASEFGGIELGDVITVAVDRASRLYMANNRHRKKGAVAALDPVYKTLPRYFMHPIYPGDPYLQSKRRIFRSVSSDLIHWSAPELILSPDDELDNLDDAFYGMVQYESGGMWIGFLNVLHMTENTMDVQLCYSRNGRDFKRIEPGRAWLRRGGADSWDRTMVNMPNPPVETGDELFVYFGGSSNHHDWWIKGMREQLAVPEATDLSLVHYALGLARMKKDRYVSLSAFDVRQGAVVTKPFETDGRQLVINAACRADGEIRVEVTDRWGKVLPGYERENCNVFRSDSVHHVVCWKDKKEIPEKSFIKLRFLMRDADLYTFEFIH